MRKANNVSQKNRTPVKAVEKKKSVVVNVSFDQSIFNRLNQMARAKGLPYEQDVIRLASVEMLDREGY